MTTTMEQIFGAPISIYTRADALSDGALITLDPQLCAEAGIQFPVDITAKAHANLIAWGERETFRKPAALQDEQGRTADVLVALTRAMRAVDPDTPITYGERFPLAVYRIAPTGHSLRPQRATFVASFTHDGTTPVITLMEEDED